MNWINAQWQWITSHRTKIAGYAAVLAGALQGYLPQMGIFLTVKQMAATTMIVGIAVALIGHYNDWVNRRAS